MTGARFTDQALIFDADDTLWENNVLFERVVEDFTEWLAHPTLDRIQVRAILDEIEAANTVVHGVGAEAFLHNLGQAFERLSDRPRTAADVARIRSLAKGLLDHEIVLMPEVVETLTELACRHRVLLLTRGSVPEQQRKIDASGLAPLFESTHIVAHKVPEVYRQLAADKELDVGRSWMIGNSPRSDILPARAVGMRAVYLPNPDTWSLEMTELDGMDEGVVTLTSFGRLTNLF
jgi:putative hydrolase of the HAD superfamily